MVRIINYKERSSEDGNSFFTLVIQGGIEMIKSNNSGKFYASAKRATIPSTFDEVTCKSLIGAEIEGRIAKEECEPYEYTVKETGEVILLNYTYVYMDDNIKEKLVHTPFKVNPETFSVNEDQETAL